jgi:small subunit ribosomal protein S30e
VAWDNNCSNLKSTILSLFTHHFVDKFSILGKYGQRYSPSVIDLSHLILIALCDALVHGSLARAGKVKSQTPKVEAQEKKKTPKGRAKKRILYNRR